MAMMEFFFKKTATYVCVAELSLYTIAVITVAMRLRDGVLYGEEEVDEVDWKR